MCHHDTDRTVTAAADKRITRKKDEMDRKLDERQASAKAKLFSIRSLSLCSSLAHLQKKCFHFFVQFSGTLAIY